MRRAVPDPRPSGRPRWSGAARSVTYQAEAWAAVDQPAVLQRHLLRAGPDLRPRRLTLVVRGRLERPPFAEITEVSPLPPVPCRASTTADGNALRVVEPELPAVARLRVALSGGTTAGWRVDDDAARLPISWNPQRDPTLVLTVICALAPDTPTLPEESDPGESSPPEPVALSTRLHIPARLRPELARLVNGTLRYVLGCTALAVGPGERCILTDHRLLQLSWTRDGYYQALLLLAARHIEPRALGVVSEHLRWLWGRCDRGTNGWMRSHLPNGAVKDRAYQADQQLYPMLELLDYRDAAGRWPATPAGSADWGRLVAETWRPSRSIHTLGWSPGTRTPPTIPRPAVPPLDPDPALAHGHPTGGPGG